MTTIPFIDQQAIDVGHLILQGAAFANPVAGALAPAVSDYSDVNDLATGSGSLSSATIAQAVIDATTRPIDAVYNPAVQAATLANLASLQVTMNPFQGSAGSAFDNATGLLSHTNDMTDGVLGVSGSINSVLDLPNQLQSDITGGLPTSFPGIPDLSGIPEFSGISSVAAIPSLGMPSLTDVAGIVSVENLAGVNLPGVPDLSSVTAGFSASILDSSFGGVGGLLSGNTASIASAALTGMNPLGGDMTSLVAGLALPGVGGSAAIVASTASLTSNLTSFAPGLGSLAGPFGDYAGGMGDLFGSEAAGLFGAACTLPGVPSGCGSASSAYAQATSIQRAVTGPVGNSLISSVGTPALKSVLGL